MPLRKPKPSPTSNLMLSASTFDLPRMPNGANGKPSDYLSQPRPLRVLRTFLGLNRSKSTSNLDVLWASNVNTDSIAASAMNGSMLTTTTANLKISPATSSQSNVYSEPPDMMILVDLPGPLEQISTPSTISSQFSKSTTDATSVDGADVDPLVDAERDTGFRGLWRKVKPADKPDEVS